MRAFINLAGIVWLISLGSASLPAAAPVLVEKNGTASLFIDAARTPDGFAIELADVLTITFQVEGGQTLTVKAPAKLTKSPGWRLLKATPASIDKQGNNRLLWRQSFTMEPLAPGALTLALEPLVISENSTANHETPWRPVPVQVRTSIVAPDLKALRDPVMIEASPPEEDADVWPWFALGAVLIASIALVLGYRYWRRRSRRSAGATETRALHQLNRLIALRLPERNEIQRFHGILANVLRRYLEKKLHLPARRRTTREFLELLQTCAALPDPDKEFLRHLFTACDLAKFGRADVSIDECATRAAKIRGFIQGMVGGGPPLSGQSTLTK